MTRKTSFAFLPRLRGAGPRFLAAALMIGATPRLARAQLIAEEPVEIGAQPQFFVHDYLVDNRYAAKSPATRRVLRHFHAPVKHGDAPVLIDPGAVPSHLALRFDAGAGLFCLWYQANVLVVTGTQSKKGGVLGHKHIRHAESRDGLHWTLPDIGLIEYQGSKNNNICFIREGMFSDPRLLRAAGAGISSLCFLNEWAMPAADRRGYKYLMTYTLRGSGGAEDEKTRSN